MSEIIVHYPGAESRGASFVCPHCLAPEAMFVQKLDTPGWWCDDCKEPVVVPEWLITWLGIEVENV